MHQTSGVGDGQAGEYRAHHRGGGVWGHGATLGEQLTQSAARDELHDEEQVVAVGPEVVDVDEVRVVELCHRPGLTAETLPEDRVGDVLLVEDLGGDGAPQTEIDAAPDHGHASAGDRVIDAVPVLEEVSHCQLSHGDSMVHTRVRTPTWAVEWTA